jgi:clan AA aspartic protease
LDTGFTECLGLPRQLIEALGLIYTEDTNLELADGSLLRTSVYDAEIDWLGERIEVEAISTNGGTLVGLGLLYGSKLTMDVVEGGVVTVEPLQPSQ